MEFSALDKIYVLSKTTKWLSIMARLSQNGLGIINNIAGPISNISTSKNQ